MADFKICYDVNDAKLKGPVDNLKATDHHLIICAKKRCSWLTVRVITVTGTVLVATEFRGFCAHFMMLPPLTFKNM